MSQPGPALYSTVYHLRNGGYGAQGPALPRGLKPTCVVLCAVITLNLHHITLHSSRRHANSSLSPPYSVRRCWKDAIATSSCRGLLPEEILRRLRSIFKKLSLALYGDPKNAKKLSLTEADSGFLNARDYL